MDFSMLLLTEDSGDDAHEVLRHVVAAILRLVDGNVDLRTQWHRPPTRDGRLAMAALTFKARKNRRARVDLAREIVDQLSHEAFVAVHLDGDMPWGHSAKGARSERLAEFEGHILPGVKTGLDEMQVPQHLDNLLFVRPYYSMEAWLFQNIDVLRRIYQSRNRNHLDLALIEAWAQDPGLLDEVVKPKENSLGIHDRHNKALAEQLPAARLDRVGKSFTATTTAFRQNRALCEVLERSRFR